MRDAGQRLPGPAGGSGNGEQIAGIRAALFEHSLIPGLLRTEAYARAVLETPPPLLWALLDEHELTRQIGSAKVMHDQLARLAALARRPNIPVQVVPGLGAHPGLLGAFAIALTGRASLSLIETAIEE